VSAASESDADVADLLRRRDLSELVPPLAKAIRNACPGMTVLLAGAPAEGMENVYREAGVDDFIHVRANCLRILSDIHRSREVSPEKKSRGAC
jgi:methylmalonyl-CoA mutase